MKPKILCIIGESGTGKSELAEYIENKYQIPMIRSYTDRPQRNKDDTGHTFLTVKEFDKLKHEDMIAFNDRFQARYCCLKQDVQPLNTYVIDEEGLKMLVNGFGDLYNIKSVRVHRKLNLREKQIDKERLNRDNGNFNMAFTDFDYHITNNNDLNSFYCKIDDTVKLFFGDSL